MFILVYFELGERSASDLIQKLLLSEVCVNCVIIVYDLD